MRPRPVAATNVLAIVLVAIGLAAAGCAEAPVSAVSIPIPALPVTAPSAAAASDAGAAAPPEKGLHVDLLANGSFAVEGAMVDDNGLREAFVRHGHDDLVVFRAAPDAEWRSVIELVDRLKQSGSGDCPFAFAVRTDPTLRTTVMSLPKAGRAPVPALSDVPVGNGIVTGGSTVLSVAISREGAMYVDGVPLSGSLRDRLADTKGSPDHTIVVNADVKARFDVVVDAIRAAQGVGAKVMLGVSASLPAPAPPTPVPAGTRPRAPRLDQCPFPAAADKEAIDEATVTLRIAVDAKGKAASTIVSDPGHGFGPAAKACAEKAKWEPARDPSGKAIAGDLVLRVRFVR